MCVFSFPYDVPTLGKALCLVMEDFDRVFSFKELNQVEEKTISLYGKILNVIRRIQIARRFQ